jgi:hypothetical protein
MIMSGCFFSCDCLGNTPFVYFIQTMVISLKATALAGGELQFPLPKAFSKESLATIVEAKFQCFDVHFDDVSFLSL